MQKIIRQRNYTKMLIRAMYRLFMGISPPNLSFFFLFLKLNIVGNRMVLKIFFVNHTYR